MGAFLALIVAMALVAQAPATAGSSSVSVRAEVTIPPDVRITNLSYVPRPFDPRAGTARVTYDLSTLATSSAIVSDMLGTTVNVLGPWGCAPGANAAEWDGTRFLGLLVEPTWYRYGLTATDGRTWDTTSVIVAVSYGPPLSLVGQPPRPRRFKPPDKAVTLTAILSRDAGVGVTIRYSRGLVVRTIPPVYCPAGAFTCTWNGTDDAGRVAAAGDYTYTITGTDSGGASSAASDTVALSIAR